MALKWKWTARERMIAIVLGVVAVLGVFLQFILPWLTGGTDSIQDQIEMAQKKLLRNQRLIREGRTVGQEYRSLLARYKQTKSQEEIMSSMLSDIQAVSGRIDIPITNLKPNKVKKIESANHFSVSMSIEGRLTDILHFVHIMQSPPYDYYLDEINLRREFFKAEKLRCQLVFKQILLP